MLIALNGWRVVKKLRYTTLKSNVRAASELGKFIFLLRAVDYALGCLARHWLQNQLERIYEELYEALERSLGILKWDRSCDIWGQQFRNQKQNGLILNVLFSILLLIFLRETS